MDSVLIQSSLPGIPVHRGKVRDVYDFGDRLLFVATDRISAFDYILPNGIPCKGEVLTRLSRFWFGILGVRHHCLNSDLTSLPLPPNTDVDALRPRSMVVTKTQVIPIECVVRGFLSGSAWKEYLKSGTVCGLSLPKGLEESSQLPEPIFTPARKAATGHDENITFEQMWTLVGESLSRRLRDLSLEVYQKGCEHAATKGILMADTKFEFGLRGDELILIDEVMTPDSSRFWPAEEYGPGRGQASFDKQFVRDWLEQSGWDKNSPPPSLPTLVIQRTSNRYIEVYERLTGETF